MFKLSDVVLPSYLDGRHFTVGVPDVENTPGYIDLTDDQLKLVSERLECKDPQFDNTLWIYHGTSLANARNIIESKSFVPLVRRGMEYSSGLYLGCRGIAEYFAVSTAYSKGELYSSPDTTPALLVFLKRDIDNHFSNKLYADTISDVNPPSNVLWKHGVVDLYPIEESTEVDRLSVVYPKSGLVYISSQTPINLSEITVGLLY